MTRSVSSTLATICIVTCLLSIWSAFTGTTKLSTGISSRIQPNGVSSRIQPIGISFIARQVRENIGRVRRGPGLLARQKLLHPKAGFEGVGVGRRRLRVRSGTIDWWGLEEDQDDGRYKMRENKLLHSVFLVKDLDKTVQFLSKAFGMKVLRTREIPSQKATCVYMGYGPEGEYFTIQLYGKPDAPGYDLGDSFWGYALVLPCEKDTDVLDDAKLRPLGGEVVEPMSMWCLGANMVPDEDPELVKTIERGYAFGPSKMVFEVTNGTIRDPLARLRLRVLDLEKSIKFYESLGMKLHQKRAHLLDEPFDTRMTAIMGYGENENDSSNLELIYLYNSHELDLGEKFRQVSIATKNVTAAVERMKEDGYDFFKEPGSLESVGGTEVAAIKDPDGYVVVLVKDEDFQKEVSEAGSSKEANTLAPATGD